MSRFATIPAIALLVALSATAGADDMAAAAQGLCDNVKSCALEQIAREDLTEEMREMMVPMLDNMCASMQSSVKQVPTGHALYQPAVACLRSMESLTCAQIQDSKQVVTPECKEYERLAKAAAGLTTTPQ